MCNILIVNGPNLNILKSRESLYGDMSLEEIQQITMKKIDKRSVQLTWRQSNSEGDIIDWLQNTDDFDAIIINPGGYTHSSVAILDALKSLDLPKVEVHLSLVSARESFRQQRITTVGCDMAIEGAGKFAYLLAIEYILLLEKN